MLNDVIKRLYDGELAPCEHSVVPGCQRDKVSHEISRKAESLRKELTEEQKRIFEEVLSDHMLLGALAEEDGFELGFRLGGQFVMAILSE